MPPTVACAISQPLATVTRPGTNTECVGSNPITPSLTHCTLSGGDSKVGTLLYNVQSLLPRQSKPQPVARESFTACNLFELRFNTYLGKKRLESSVTQWSSIRIFLVLSSSTIRRMTINTCETCVVSRSCWTSLSTVSSLTPPCDATECTLCSITSSTEGSTATDSATQSSAPSKGASLRYFKMVSLPHLQYSWIL